MTAFRHTQISSVYNFACPVVVFMQTLALSYDSGFSCSCCKQVITYYIGFNPPIKYTY